MLTVITILLVMLNIGLACNVLVLLAILGKLTEKPKDFEQAKADMFKAWGDKVVSDFKQ